MDLNRQVTLPYDSEGLFEQFRAEQAEEARGVSPPRRLMRRRTQLSLGEAIVIDCGLGSQSSIFGGSPFTRVPEGPSSPAGVETEVLEPLDVARGSTSSIRLLVASLDAEINSPVISVMSSEDLASGQEVPPLPPPAETPIAAPKWILGSGSWSTKSMPLSEEKIDTKTKRRGSREC